MTTINYGDLLVYRGAVLVITFVVWLSLGLV